MTELADDFWTRLDLDGKRSRKAAYMRDFRRGIRRRADRPPLIVRLLNGLDRDPGRVVRPELGPCWEWTGAKSAAGYGVIRGDDGKLVSTHRVALEARLGRPIGEGLWACHRCDNKICCRGAHLYEGTPSDNAFDTYERIRPMRRRGEQV